MSVKQFIKELSGHRVEGELLKTMFTTLVTSFVTLGVMYFLILRDVVDFLPKYGLFIFLAIIGYTLVLPAIHQVRAFKQFPCMTGMMIGMTVGMISGFLAGFYIGATNGMFWGSVYGMSVGILLGVWKGKCCGVMGVMEGLMAGFMGGLMGAMTAVMMYNDNLKAAAVLILVVCGLILICLNYMLYDETKNEDRVHHHDQFSNIVISFILTISTIWFMVYGPKSPIFA